MDAIANLLVVLGASVGVVETLTSVVLLDGPVVLLAAEKDVLAVVV